MRGVRVDEETSTIIISSSINYQSSSVAAKRKQKRETGYLISVCLNESLKAGAE